MRLQKEYRNMGYSHRHSSRLYFCSSSSITCCLPRYLQYSIYSSLIRQKQCKEYKEVGERNDLLYK